MVLWGWTGRNWGEEGKLKKVAVDLKKVRVLCMWSERETPKLPLNHCSFPGDRSTPPGDHRNQIADNTCQRNWIRPSHSCG